MMELFRSHRDGVIVILSFFLSLALGSLIIALYGVDPAEAAREMLLGALGDSQARLGFLARVVPLVLLTTATSVAFYGGVWNIGAEGQLYVGAFASAWVGLTFPSLPGWILIPLGLTVALAASCLWGLMPLAVSSRRGVSLVVLTIMLNSLGTLATSALTVGPYASRSAASGMTERIPAAMRLARFDPASTANSGIWIALAAFVLTAVLMLRSLWGYEWRCCRLNSRFARYGGVWVERAQFRAMTFSAALAGLAGALLVMGDHYRFRVGISPGHAWTGMILSMMVAYHPLGGLAAALIYGLMEAGAIQMELVTGVPVEMVQIVICTAVLFVTAGLACANRMASRLRED